MIYLLGTLFLIAIVSYLIYLIVYSVRTHIMQQKEKKMDNGIFYKERKLAASLLENEEPEEAEDTPLTDA